MCLNMLYYGLMASSAHEPVSKLLTVTNEVVKLVF